ncbi:MAG: hypothetical protein E7624_08685 [Ruminococcaceae bacterium]|nr:hypothetical protein [Oscillospiraceae bacterium]
MMKKLSRILLLLLILTVSLVAAVACNDPENGGSTAIEISVQESGMPQLLYVAGEPLDLSNGVLTVKEGDKVSELPLNAEGITVSGFDESKVGEQTLTITYKGKTTTITVKVVERMVAAGFTGDYLVGDAFDLSKGYLKITRNDGTDYKVVFSDSKLTLTGFDTATAGQKTVTASYKAGDATYTCSFTVTVHNVENATLTAPKKQSYNSHDAVLDVTGGVLVLTGNNGALKKEIPVTADMVSGFDITAVNKDNTPFTQTLSVAFGGKTYQYDVKLIYTGVSLFKEECVAFRDMDWSGTEYPDYASLGDLALSLMEIYMDLSFAEQSYISKDEYLNVARTALMYGMDSMEDEFTAMEGAFTIVGGEVYFTCESYQGVKDAVEMLRDEENDVYAISPLLLQMIEAFAKESVTEDVLFGDYGMIDVETCELVLEVLEHVLNVGEKSALIGADWREVGTKTYENHIHALYSTLVSTEYDNSLLSELYTLVSTWREENDLFDILYTYYYDEGDFTTLRQLAPLGLPGELRLVLAHAYGMIDQLTKISQYAQNDATMLFYHYYAALDAAEKIKNGPDGMVKDIYNNLPVNAIMDMDESTPFYIDDLLAYLCTMEGGYYQFCGTMLGIESYHTLLDLYIELVMKSLQDPEFEGSAQFMADVDTMFALFVALSPAQQLNFLNTINVFYIMDEPPLMFETNEDAEALACLFVLILNEHFEGKLSESAASVYRDLMIAVEVYAKRFSIEDWKTTFLAKLDAVGTAVKNLEGTDRDVFDAYFSDLYAKYDAIRQRYDDDAEEPSLGEWQDEFEELAEALVNAELSYHLIIEGQMPMYSMMLSAYERALTIAENIQTNAPLAIQQIYYYEELYQLLDLDAEEGEEFTTPFVSFDHIMTSLRAIYINCLLTLNQGSGIYDYYVESKLPAFLDAAYDVIWTYMYRDEDPETIDFDKARMFAVMKMFREMSAEEQMVFAVWMDAEYGLYYSALDAFFEELNMTEKAHNAAVLLQQLENYALIYRVVLTQETLDTVAMGLQELKDAYALLVSEEDKASFADFEEAYAYYVQLCEQLIAAGVPAV